MGELGITVCHWDLRGQMLLGLPLLQFLVKILSAEAKCPSQNAMAVPHLVKACVLGRKVTLVSHCPLGGPGCAQAAFPMRLALWLAGCQHRHTVASSVSQCFPAP